MIYQIDTEGDLTDTLSEWTRLNLIESYHAAKEISDGTDPILKHLRKVIRYYSTSTQWKEWKESI